MPIDFRDLLEMETATDQNQYLAAWAAKTKVYGDTALIDFLKERSNKVSFPVPSDVMLIPPLAINVAASGAQLTSFREVMNFDNMMLAFAKTSEYEAAGTVWMLDAVGTSDKDSLSVSQLESAMWKWSPEAYLMSSAHAPSRRFSFDVPLPAQVVDIKVAQRQSPPASGGVLMANPVPLFSGRAVVTAWYAQMLEALRRGDEEQVIKLLEAGMSVPIRLKITTDPDECRLVALRFSESMFSTAAAAAAGSFWKFAEKSARLTSFRNGVAQSFSLQLLKAELKSMD